MGEIRSSGGDLRVGAGAMTIAMRAAVGDGARERWLRVAVVREGRIASERLLSPKSALTWGRGDVDVVVADAADAKAVLFETDSEGGARVCVPRGATGRVVVGGEARALDAHGAQRIELDREGRGKLRLPGAEGVIVLFQRVPRPPPRVTPQLPASVRGGFLAHVDWLFTALVTSSFMLHFAFVLGMSEADWPVQTTLAAEYIETGIIFLPEVDPPEIEEQPIDASVEVAETEIEPGDGDTDPTTAQPREVVARREPRTSTRSTSTSSAGDPSVEEITGDVLAQVDTLMIGAAGVDGALTDVLRGAPTVGRAEDVMAEVDGVQIASTDRGVLRTRDGGRGVAATCTDEMRAAGECLGALRRTGPVEGPREQTEGPALVERRPRVLAPDRDEIIEDGPGEIDERVLLAALRGRMRIIQTCYEHELSRTPDLSGRIRVTLTIEQVGTISGVRIAEDTVGSDALASCVTRAVSGMRLREGAEGGRLTVAYPIVFSPQR